MAKQGQGIFTSNFLINLFVKKAYRIAKILHKYNWLRMNVSLMIWNNFYHIF